MTNNAFDATYTNEVNMDDASDLANEVDQAAGADSAIVLYKTICD